MRAALIDKFCVDRVIDHRVIRVPGVPAVTRMTISVIRRSLIALPALGAAYDRARW
jgi:hypothetical protein